MRVSDAFPSEMPFISFRACLLFLRNVSETKTGGSFKYILERQKANEFDHLPEFREILHSVLNFLQTIPNSICLMGDLEN